MTVAIVEVKDPAAALMPPPPAATGEYIASLRDNAGIALSSFDWVAEKLFGVSLIAQFVKPFTGDWAALEVAANGWLNAGKALEAGRDNLVAGRTQMAAVWQGEAAERCAYRMGDIAALYDSQSQGCATLSAQLTHIIEVSKATGEFVAGLLSLINDWLMRLAIELATPVIGWIGGAIDAAATSTQFFMWVQKLIKAIDTLISVAQLAMRAVMAVQRLFAVAIKGMNAVTNAAHAGAGAYMDDTSQVQFGAT